MPIDNTPHGNPTTANNDAANGVGDEAGTATPHLSDKPNPQLAGETEARENAGRGIHNVQDVGGTPERDRQAQAGQAQRDDAPNTGPDAMQSDEADRLRGTPDDRPAAARQESSDDIGTARPSAH